MNTNNLEADVCWMAVASRDARADGTFVYAVKTTGVYCRPSCGSRLAKRENVQFYANPAAAEADGWRACKRCTPNAEPPAQVLVEQICAAIDAALEAGDSRVTLESLGAQIGMSPFHLQRVFKRAMGVSPLQYVKAKRVGKVTDALRGGSNVSGTVLEALTESGLASSSRTYEQLTEVIGMTPRAYQKGGDGTRITYGLFDSPLGRMLIGGTDRGLCGVSFADTDTELIEGLRNEYPTATAIRDDQDTRLQTWCAALNAHLQGGSNHADLSALPLDVQATAFQARVWEALRRIPAGVTYSYSELARQIDAPKAVRAVASACGSNPVAVVIPCHRIVRENGDLGGYKWGLPRKERLLALEGVRSGRLVE